MVILAALAAGCGGPHGPGTPSRTLVIRSTPPGAAVTLNLEEVGTTPLELPFTWHGTYEVLLRKPGYRAARVLWKVRPGFGRSFPVDLLSEGGLGLLTGDERRTLEVTLEPDSPPDEAELRRIVEEARRGLAERFPEATAPSPTAPPATPPAP